MEAVVLHRVGFLEHFCPKQGQDFKPSAATLYLNMGQVPPPPPPRAAIMSLRFIPIDILHKRAAWGNYMYYMWKSSADDLIILV